MVKKQKGVGFTAVVALEMLVEGVRAGIAADAGCDRGGARPRVHPQGHQAFELRHGQEQEPNTRLSRGLRTGQNTPQQKWHRPTLIRLGLPIEQRPTADFRGTITYASLNAHNKIVYRLPDSRICLAGTICGVSIS